jgi:hypothetical protein
MKWRRFKVMAMNKYPSIQRTDVWAALTLSQGKSRLFPVRHFRDLCCDAARAEKCVSAPIYSYLQK